MKFVVFCPDHRSGGPFALLQLNQALVDLGYSSEVLFYDRASIRHNPRNGSCAVTYPRAIGLSVDFATFKTCTGFDRDSILIFPEVQLELLKRFHALGYRRKVFWWLSWDYAPLGEINTFGNALVLMSCFHMFQSEYARRKASEFGFRGPLVSDWTIAPARVPGAVQKTNDICFLPAKAPGSEGVIAELERRFSVIPIRGMTPAQVSEVLGRSMVFLDFGHQPGKDRIPREAVLHDCVPVVRNVGSAAYEEDCPLPAKLKLETRSMASSRELGDLIDAIKSTYPDFLMSLQPFWAKTQGEKALFYDQVRRLIALLTKETAASRVSRG